MPKPSWFAVRAFRADGTLIDPNQDPGSGPANPDTPPGQSEDPPEPEIKAVDVAEVTIRGYIGEWGITDRSFIEEVEALGQVSQFRLLINSRGGELDHALAIFDYLRSHSAKVTGRVTGVAMSSASVILMACDHIEMPANTVLMVHNPWNCACGDAEDMQQASDQLKVWTQALIETYVARTGKTAEEVAALMDAETFMTAQDAVDGGFADVVLPIERAASAAAGVSPMAMAYASALDIPVAVADRLARQAEAAPESQTVVQPEGGDPPSGVPAAAAGSKPPAKPISGRSGNSESPTFAAQVSALAVAAGLGDYVQAWLLDAGIETVAQAQAAIAEAREIRDLCVYAKADDMAGVFIRSRKPLAEVRAALVDARAIAADRAHADGYARGEGTPASQRQNAPEMGDVYARNRETAMAAFPNLFHL